MLNIIRKLCGSVYPAGMFILLIIFITGFHMTAYATEVVIAGPQADEEWVADGLKLLVEEEKAEEAGESVTEAESGTGAETVLSGVSGAKSAPQPEKSPAPFRMKIRFDKHFETLMLSDTRTWRYRHRDGYYIWDDDKVYAYFEKLKAKYDTPVGVVDFVTHDHREMTFQSTNCGWQMNVSVSVSEFEEAVDSGETIFDPAWNSGCIYSSENGVGQKYVEVDIDRQKLFLFEYGELLLESDCVTGTYQYADTTPGVFQVIYKASPSVLKDKDPEGNAYEQPVEYWIAFNGAQGIHDATWRSEFGGDYYKTWGSHGCVNLPLEAAKRVYEEVYTYYPVVVY